MVAGPVPPVTYPPLLRVDVLGLVPHLEISRDPAGSVIAATPSTQRNPKEPPEPYPESWMHTIENVRTGVPWLMMSIHGSAAEERAEIAFERGALRAPYVPRNREGFPTNRGVWVLCLCVEQSFTILANGVFK